MGTVKVKGMSCEHCQASVAKAVSGVKGVGSVEVNLEKGTAVWKDTDAAAPASVDEIRKAIRAIGFDTE